MYTCIALKVGFIVVWYRKKEITTVELNTVLQNWDGEFGDRREDMSRMGTTDNTVTDRQGKRVLVGDH